MEFIKADSEYIPEAKPDDTPFVAAEYSGWAGEPFLVIRTPDRTLTKEEMTTLYNDGEGLTYPFKTD